MDPLTIAALFGPLLVDAGKGLIARFIAPKEFKPAKVEDFIAMRELELRWFQAVNAAGGSGPTYPWVEAVVRLMRPAVAAVTMLTWAHAHGCFWDAAQLDTASVDNFAAAVGFYLFGDRTLFYTRRAMAGAS